jgi:hypothetical protein
MPLIWLAFVTSTLGFTSAVPFLATVPAAACLLVALSRTRAVGHESANARVLAVGAVLTSVFLAQMLIAVGFSRGTGLALVLGVASLCTALAAVAVPRVFWIHLPVVAALHVVWVRAVDSDIDVGYFVRNSTAALLDGRNPYSLTFPNPYSAAETPNLWAAELVDGDRILIGFPYLPGTLLGYLPGHLLGEVRLASVAAMLIATTLIWRMTTEPVGRLLVAALPLTPLALLVTTQYWVEPLMVLGVALLVWAMRHGSRWWGALSLVLLLTVKQYAVLWLPLEKTVRRQLGLRTLIAGVVASAVLVLAALVPDPSGFWRAVVETQFLQPYRPDSVSLAVDLVNAGLPLPVVALSVGSLLAGLGAALWVRATAPDSASWAALGIGLSLLTCVLLSKQAFANYYFLVNACVVVGIALWPHELGLDGPSTKPDDRSRRDTESA